MPGLHPANIKHSTTDAALKGGNQSRDAPGGQAASTPGMKLERGWPTPEISCNLQRRPGRIRIVSFDIVVPGRVAVSRLLLFLRGDAKASRTNSAHWSNSDGREHKHLSPCTVISLSAHRLKYKTTLDANLSTKKNPLVFNAHSVIKCHLPLFLASLPGSLSSLPSQTLLPCPPVPHRQIQTLTSSLLGPAWAAGPWRRDWPTTGSLVRTAPGGLD